MNEHRSVAGRVVIAGLLSLALSGCAWQGYAVSRGVRLLTGARTQVHAVIPVSSPLAAYRVIEMPRLENLLPGRMPSELEHYLNDRLAQQLHLLPSSPTIARLDDRLPSVQSPESDTPKVPTLVFEGFIDDYDPGYVGLRLVELGFNHFVLTVRFQFKDKQTGHIVCAASVTAQDDRATATARSAMDRLAQHVRTFMEAGYDR